ncbi:hypothetical protein ACIQTX_14495 [Microbacterium sp. NPDC090281]|uniref:hypothetical protein n=1 Tax=Microbacterium sp. NPDC090281 TaxID=3364208 RepID=UPI0038151BFD
MSVETYLAEDGTGSFKSWYVPDLLPSEIADICLAFVFESPYVDEVAAGVPMVGKAGQLALEYILGSQANGRSLGRVVEAQHREGNSRIAILNTSKVPLESVMDPGETDLGEADWILLDKVRRSNAATATSMMLAQANNAGRVLRDNLERRVNDLNLSPDATLVAGGVCAQRFVRSFTVKSGRAPLNVPHPARRNWQNAPTHAGLLEVRRLFLASS